MVSQTGATPEVNKSHLSIRDCALHAGNILRLIVDDKATQKHSC
jgi:hypothetical protein